jgi:hypothetical protein
MDAARTRLWIGIAIAIFLVCAAMNNLHSALYGPDFVMRGGSRLSRAFGGVGCLLVAALAVAMPYWEQRFRAAARSTSSEERRKLLSVAEQWSNGAFILQILLVVGALAAIVYSLVIIRALR